MKLAMRPAGAPTEQPSAMRGSATVATWTLVSRVTGLGRIIVVGAVLGPTYLANCFVATNTVPNMVYLAMAGSVLSAIVVPPIVRAVKSDGDRAATDLIGRLAGYLLFIGALGSIALALISPLVAHLLTFDIADDANRARGHTVTQLMVLFVAPQVVFYLIATLGAAAQQARGRFALAAAAPAAENVGVMVTIVVAGAIFGRGLDIDSAGMSLTLVLCVGSTVSVALHMALQLAGAARVGLPVRPSRRFCTDPVTREVTARLRRSLVVAASPYAAYLSLIVMAGTVPGGVLVLQMAYAVYSLPLALGGRAVSTAVLPGLSHAATNGDRCAFSAKLREGLVYGAGAGLPPLLFLVVFAYPVADFLANGRMRVGSLIAVLATCLVVLAFAQLAAGLKEVAVNGLFAGLNIRGPQIAALLNLAITLGAGLVSTALLSGPSRLVGLSATILMADLAAAAAAILLAHRMIRPGRVIDARRLALLGWASAAMLPALLAGGYAVHALHANRFAEHAVAGVSGLVAVGCYGLTLRAKAEVGS